MTVAPCHLPPCGGGRRREAAPGGGCHGGGHRTQLPRSPTLPHNGGGSTKERAIATREGARGSFRISRRCGVSQRLMYRGVGKPFAVDRYGIALFCHVTSFGKEFLRVVAGIDRESLGAAAAGAFFQRLGQH